jgi:hypothetical protein
LELAFHLKVSSEIFQRNLTEAVGDLNGTFTIADDIIIAGCGHTDEEAKRDHETKLCKLYARCKEQNIILNDEKKEIRLKEITFQIPSIRTVLAPNDIVRMVLSSWSIGSNYRLA